MSEGEVFRPTTLAELTGAIRNLTRLIELSDDDDLNEKLEALIAARIEKLKACGWVLRELDSEQEVLDKEIARLKERKAKVAREQERLTDYVLYNLEDGEKAEDSLITISVRKSSRLIVDDADLIPDDYITVEVTRAIRKREVKAALERGEVIPGAHIEKFRNLQVK